jgi:hypothetical protein
MAGVMPQQLSSGDGPEFEEIRRAVIPVPARIGFATISRAGGEHGWFEAQWLWRVRGLIDRMLGGPGLSRGRRDPAVLSCGDPLDFWRVVAVDPDRRLSLRAEMKLPGEGGLEFLVEPSGPSECTVYLIARFRPRGVAGWLYWHAAAPFHHFVLRGMLRGIRREALQVHAGRDGFGQAARGGGGVQTEFITASREVP